MGGVERKEIGQDALYKRIVILRSSKPFDCSLSYILERESMARRWSSKHREGLK